MTAADTTPRQGVVVQNFQNEADAEQAVRDLLDAGFRAEEINVVAKDRDRATAVTDEIDDDPDEVLLGTGVGALTGGLLGGILGLLAGAAALAIPGIGIVAIGPLAAALSGAGLGAVTGGIAGALAALGVSDVEAQRHQEHLEAGDILIIVDAGAREAEARRILESRANPEVPFV